MRIQRMDICFANGKRQYWSRKALYLLALVFFVFPTILTAGTFTNWPTYASEPLANWPKASEYDQLVEDFTWCHNALIEHCLVSGVSTSGISPASNGTRLPKADVENFKSKSQTLITCFVDDSQYASFTNTGSIPMLTVTGVIAILSLPTDYFQQTLTRCLHEVVPPGWPSGYGVSGLMDVICALKWTTHHRNTDDDYTGAYVDSWLGRYGSGADYTYQASLTSTRNGYDQGWSNDYPGMWLWVYYQVQRERVYLLYYPGPHLNTRRAQSKPKLSPIVVPDDVTYNWDCFILGQQEGTNDWYNWDWDGTLRLWESSAAAASATQVITTSAITDDDNTFPFDLSPTWTNDPGGYFFDREGSYVKVVDWILKWNFAYKQ